MPSIHNIDHERKLIITSWEGDIHDQELISTLIAYQKNIQSQPELTDFHELLDFTQARKIKLSRYGIRNLSKIAVLTDAQRSHTKLAIIVNSALAYGFARMYIAYRSFSNDSSKDIQVYRNYHDAMNWITNTSDDAD